MGEIVARGSGDDRRRRHRADRRHGHSPRLRGRRRPLQRPSARGRHRECAGDRSGAAAIAGQPRRRLPYLRLQPRRIPARTAAAGSSRISAPAAATARTRPPCCGWPDARPLTAPSLRRCPSTFARHPPAPANAGQIPPISRPQPMPPGLTVAKASRRSRRPVPRPPDPACNLARWRGMTARRVTAPSGQGPGGRGSGAGQGRCGGWGGLHSGQASSPCSAAGAGGRPCERHPLGS